MKCQGERSLRLRRPGGMRQPRPKSRQRASLWLVAGRKNAGAAERRPSSGSRRSARFSGKARRTPAPAACGCIGAQAKTLLGRRSGRRQDDPRPVRRGAATCERVEAEVSAPRLALALPSLPIWCERTEDPRLKILRDVHRRPPEHAKRSRFGPSQH
jgi:hypothetical protein